MNLSVYLFGQFNAGYSQYPDDFSKKVFETFYNKSLSTSQIVIHRDDNLMYYGYIRKLDSGNNYIGLCTVINGLCITEIEALFRIYEDIIESMVRNGYLIHLNDYGQLCTSVSKLYESTEEISQIKSQVSSGFGRLENSVMPLPAIRYGIAKDSMKEFSVHDDNENIISSTYTYGYTFVYKSKDFNTPALNSFKGIIERKEKENKALEQKISDTQQKLEKVKAEKRRTKAVAILASILVFAGMIGIIVYSSISGQLEMTQDELYNLNNTLNSTRAELSNLQEELNQTRDNLTRANNNIVELTRLRNQLRDSLNVKNNRIAQLLQDNRILDNELQNVRRMAQVNQDINPQDLSFKVYSKSKKNYLYTTSKDTWTLYMLNNNVNEHTIYVYYKGAYIKAQTIKAPI